MPQYQVKGKHIYRASIVPTRMGTKPDGSPDMVDQPGPMTRVEAGTILDDVTDAELRAFPDRFAPVQPEGDQPEAPADTTQATIAARSAAHSTTAGPIPPGTTAEQAAQATAARQRPATVTAADQGTATGEATEEPSHGSARHTRRSGSD